MLEYNFRHGTVLVLSELEVLATTSTSTLNFFNMIR